MHMEVSTIDNSSWRKNGPHSSTIDVLLCVHKINYTHLHDNTSDVLLSLLVLLNNWLTSNTAGGLDAIVLLLSATTLFSDWLVSATYLYGLAVDDWVSMATGNCVMTLFLVNSGWGTGRLAGRTVRSGLLSVEVFCLKLAGLFNWNITCNVW